MIEERFFRLLELVGEIGIGLSILAWLVVVAGVVAMAWLMRSERRVHVRVAGAAACAVAAVCNLVDFHVTLGVSPTLAMEANPLWRNVVDRWGLNVAWWYGFTGKCLVAVLAGQMFAYYLANRWRIVPERPPDSAAGFLREMGSRSNGLAERLLALLTLFAFLFAGIQVLYLYIALLNTTDDPALYARLPSAPLVIMAWVATLTVGWLLIAYRDASPR